MSYFFGYRFQALKRRISALEDDIGSTTPIRRLRQKTSLSTPQNLSLPIYRSPLSSCGTGAQPLISNRKPFPVEEPKYRTLRTENKDNSTPSTSFNPVPSKSSEMATRILEQLEKLVPKEKLSRGAKSPSKLTPGMLRGQALRSLEYVDSSKILQNALESHESEELCDTSQLDARATTSQNQDKIEENGPEKFIVSLETVAPVGICRTAVSVKDSVGVHTAGSVVTATVTQPPQKKWAFHISADEVGGVSFFGLCSLEGCFFFFFPAMPPLAGFEHKTSRSMVDHSANLKPLGFSGSCSQSMH